MNAVVYEDGKLQVKTIQENMQDNIQEKEEDNGNRPNSDNSVDSGSSGRILHGKDLSPVGSTDQIQN